MCAKQNKNPSPYKTSKRGESKNVKDLWLVALLTIAAVFHTGERQAQWVPLC